MPARMNPRRAKRAAVLLTLSLGLPACGSKGADCRAMMKTINPQVEKQQALSQRETGKLDDVGAVTGEIASLATETADALSKLELRTPELARFSADYQAMERELAGSAKGVSDAIAAGSPDVLKRLQAFDVAVDGTAKREAELVEGMNAFCAR
jgi:hypothetical protein